MSYDRRIVGAKASPNGKTFLRIQDGRENFEVEVVGFDGFRRTDSGEKVDQLIDVDKVELHVHDLEKLLNVPRKILCLGKLIPRREMRMRGWSTMGYSVPEVHEESFIVTTSNGLIGDMGFCVLKMYENRAVVSPIYVPDVYRGFGFARRLLKEAEAIALKEGKPQILAEVYKMNHESNALFESMGYEKRGWPAKDGLWIWKKNLGESKLK